MIATIELERNQDACCGDDCCSETEAKSEGLSATDRLESDVDIKYAVRSNYGQIATAAVKAAAAAVVAATRHPLRPIATARKKVTPTLPISDSVAVFLTILPTSSQVSMSWILAPAPVSTPSSHGNRLAQRDASLAST